MRRTSSALVALFALACPAPDSTDSGAPVACVTQDLRLPLDLWVMALARTGDGRTWALGEIGSTWIDAGGGWEEGPPLVYGMDRGLAGGPTELWATDGESLYHTAGGEWAAIDADITAGSYVERFTALASGDLVLATAEACDDCDGADVTLRVGLPGAWTTQELGYNLAYPGAAAANGDLALVTLGDTAWTWDGTTWTDSALPEARGWVDATALADGWALLSADGRVVRGTPGAWVEDAVGSGVWYGHLAATGPDDVWVVGTDQDGVIGLAAHDAGAGFVAVPTPGEPLYAAIADGPGQVIAGTRGPALLGGGADGLAESWRTAHFRGGLVAEGPRGVALVVATDGQLSAFGGTSWSVLDTTDAWWWATASCPDAAYALAPDGTLARWDGTTVTYDLDLLAADAETWWNAVAVTEACEVVVAGTVMDEDGGLYGRITTRGPSGWTDLPWPAGGSGVTALHARTLDTLVLATESATYVGDGAAWTEVVGVPGRIVRIADRPDGALWVGVEGDGEGLGELDGTTFTAIPGAHGRVTDLLAEGEAVFAVTDDDAGAHVERYDGAWEAWGDPPDLGRLYRDPDGALWVIGTDWTRSFCPPT